MSIDDWLEWSMSPEGEAERRKRSAEIERDTTRIIFCWNALIYGAPALYLLILAVS